MDTQNTVGGQTTPLTFGQKAVGITFNPSGDTQVGAIKAAFAAIIDQLNDMRTAAGLGEKGRLLSVAITEAQGAQMWAVKGITWQDELATPPAPPADVPAAPANTTASTDSDTANTDEDSADDEEETS